MQTLYWNLDTRIVSAQPLSRTPARVSSVRGSEAITVVLVQSVPPGAVLLGIGESVGIVLRDPANLKKGALAGPTALARGANAGSGYAGTVSTDTTLTRAAMHVDALDPSAELSLLAAQAVFYHVPAGGGTPVESLPIAWEIDPNYFRPLQAPADVIDAAASRAALGLSGANGCIPPALLGTGTPTTSTTLRGDGVWAAATLATIASSGSLLMGDSAGNAAPVAGSIDLTRVLGARLDIARAAQSLPANLLNNTGLVQGTVNADGTLTIPANGFVAWNVDGVGNGVPVYLYAAATDDVPAGALTLAPFYGSGNRNDSTSIRLPGVVRSVSTTLTSGYTFQVRVANTTGSPIKILYPSAALSDVGTALIASRADFTPVAPQPVTDMDFTRFGEGGDRVTRYARDYGLSFVYPAFDSSSSGGYGTIADPYSHFSDSETWSNFGVYGLKRGSVFHESLPLPSALTNAVIVQDVALGSLKPLPVVSALDVIPNSSLVSDGSGAYAYSWTPTDSGIANDGYANVYVVEINTAIEAVQPVAARRRMTLGANKGAVDSTPGTAYVSSSSGTWSLFLHPSDSLAPGSGSYRYEVVSRVSPAKWNGVDPGDGSMSGLQLVGGSSGYGSLGGPMRFVGDRLVVQHATTHNAVIGSGSLSRSVFYEGGDDDAIMLAWYTANPTGMSWSMNRCLFYAGTRPTDMVISHSGTGQSYARGDIADCAFIGAGRINGALACVGIKYDNVSTGVIERCLVSGVRTVFGAVMPLSTEVRDSVFLQVQKCNIGLNFHDNLVAAEPAGVTNATAIACQLAQAGASATNNLFWTRGLANGFANNELSNGINVPFNQCTCARNIFVLDPASTTALSTYLYYGSADASTLAIDYNLVINLGKGGIYAQGPSGGYTTWSAYQAGSTLDQHSMYVDLSADPRGLKAVFMDPANGDFRWAQTEVARRCAAFCRANNVGPRAVTSRLPLVPSVDEAVRLLTAA